MTLRDFLKANKALIKFKEAYHERSKIKITYRQIETNLLTTEKDFIKKALNLNESYFSYWIDLNTKWNAQLNSKITLNTIKTFGDWLRLNNLEEKFKNAYLKQHPGRKNALNKILTSVYSNVIFSSIIWSDTLEGYQFWSKQHTAWVNFCNNK